MVGQTKLHGEIPLAGQRAQAATLYPGLGDVLGQIAQVSTGEDERQATFDLFAARAAAAALPGFVGCDEAIGMHHAVAGLQVSGARRLPVEQRVLAPAVQALALGEQRPVVQRRLAAGEIADGQLQLVLQQAPFQFGGHGAEQLDLHRLVAPAKTPDGIAEALQHLVRQRLREADAQLVEQLVGHALGLALEGLDGGEQLARGGQHLLAVLQPNLRYIGNARQIDDLAKGETCLALTYTGDAGMAAARAAEAEQPFEVLYRIPREGTLIWFDTMAIPADAPHPGNARAFIDFMLQPEAIAELTNELFFANANRAATPLLDEAVSGDPDIYPPEAVRARLFAEEVLSLREQRQRTRLWTDFRSQY